MSKTLPPLAWFRAFECAARRLNFTHAANDLNLTQSAVSQHIRSLEQKLGCTLFLRHNRKLTLTDEGRRLLPSVSKSMALLREATETFDRAPDRSILSVSVSPSISQWYLVPKLEQFLSAHPHLDIRLNSKVWTDEFMGFEADVEIRFDSSQSASDGFEPICQDHLVVVASPTFEGELQNSNLIGVVGTNDTWKVWAEASHIQEELKIRSTVESHGLAVDLARAGAGIAFTSLTVAAPALIDGSLVIHSKPVIPARDGYYVSTKDNDNRELAKQFVIWLKAAIAECLGSLEEQVN